VLIPIIKNTDGSTNWTGGACEQACQRLSYAAAPVVVIGLVPRGHVAQAIAAAIPGFAVLG
jgi:hypothetical protein